MKKPRCFSHRGFLLFGSVLVREHNGGARLAPVAGVDLDFQGMQALPPGARDDDSKQTASGKSLHGGRDTHPQNIMPNAFPIVAMIGMGNGLFNECTDRRRHGDMNAGEVLGGDFSQVAGAGVNQDAVGNGLGTGIDGNDHEAIQRMAGLMDNVARLRNRITG